MSTLAITDEVLLAFADDVGATGPVAVVGGRTRWQHGGVVHDGTRLLTAPTGIVAYSAPEMTVQVRAGTTVAELDAALEAEGQRTSLPDRGGTVGGAVAVGENVVEVMGRGRLRDAVLQVRYVNADGEPVTGGGPVVKNVTGFNLPKLMTGSLGTFGLFAEFVLRTNPIPPATRWLSATGVDPVVALDALYRPSAVLWDGLSTWVHLEGHHADIEVESATLRDVGGFTEVDGPPALPASRWSITPAAAAALDRVDMGGFVASIGVGTVWAKEPAPSSPRGEVNDAVAERLKQNFDPAGRLNPGRRPGS